MIFTLRPVCIELIFFLKIPNYLYVVNMLASSLHNLFLGHFFDFEHYLVYTVRVNESMSESFALVEQEVDVDVAKDLLLEPLN